MWKWDARVGAWRCDAIHYARDAGGAEPAVRGGLSRRVAGAGSGLVAEEGSARASGRAEGGARRVGAGGPARADHHADRDRQDGGGLCRDGRDAGGDAGRGARAGPDVPVASADPGDVRLRRRDRRRHHVRHPAGHGDDVRQRVHPHGQDGGGLRPADLRRGAPSARPVPARGRDPQRRDDAAGTDRHARAVRRPARGPRLAHRPGGVSICRSSRCGARRWRTSTWSASRWRSPTSSRRRTTSAAGSCGTSSPRAARRLPGYSWQDLCKEMGKDPQARHAQKAYYLKQSIEDRAAEKLRVLEDIFRLHFGQQTIVFAGSNAMAIEVSKRFLVPTHPLAHAQAGAAGRARRLREGRSSPSSWPIACSTRAWTSPRPRWRSSSAGRPRRARPRSGSAGSCGAPATPGPRCTKSSARTPRRSSGPARGEEAMLTSEQSIVEYRDGRASPTA